MVDSSGMEPSFARKECTEDGTTRGKKRCDARKLFSLQENVSQIHARPVDRACLCRKPDRFAFDTPAQPVEKLFFLAFDNHWITSDSQRLNQRMMRIQLVREPLGPFGNSRHPIHMRDGGPNKPPVRTRQHPSS